MSVNDRVVADVYHKTRVQGDHVMIPSYWSEMDAYHVLNFFTLYVAGHLLIDPDSSTDVLLAEAAQLVAGQERTADLLYILEVIREARSGDSWNSFWWNEHGYVWLHADHAQILERVTKAIILLENMIPEAGDVCDAHLPIAVKSLYRLILPQLHQIQQYAKFSVDFAELEKAKESEVSSGTLQKMVAALPFDIPEYNNIIGLWGLPEARVAYERLDAFCKENGLITPDSNTLRYVQKRRLYDHACVYQRGKKEPVYLWPLFYEGGLAFGPERTLTLVEELCQEGIFMHRPEDDYVALTNWQSFMFDFNI